MLKSDDVPQELTENRGDKIFAIDVFNSQTRIIYSHSRAVQS